MTTSIAPLVTSQSLQLTALTVATPARTRTTDIRGNVTESWTEQADGVTTAKRRVPEATNIISSRSRFGVSLESVSVSAVTNGTVYDALGRAFSSIDGRGNATRTEYDPFGRRAATIDAAGNPTRYAYDRFGNLAAVTNALGNAIVYEYDLRGRKTYEGGATYPVRYTYDVFGNKVTMMTYRDESRGPDTGDVTTWLYDEASGVMTNKVYADGKGPRYDYDANGRLVKRTWARGIDTFYAYDGWGNLTNTTYSDDTPTVAIKYDALGRQIEAHDAAGVTTFAYDAFGANTNETVVGVAGTNVLERFTDEFGRDAGYALNGERRTVIGRDPAAGRIETMLAAGCTNAFRWFYLPGCDLKHTLLYPNGALVTWEYEPHRDLMTLVSNDVYSTFHYTYDAAGKRISKNDERYIYNVRGELVLATNVVTGAEFAYRYDDIGNRLWSREFGTNCTYVANELNQYTNIVRGGVFELSAFDLDGNQTNIVTATGEWAVEYNGENRPVRWHRAADDTSIRMAYDRMGRRVVKNDETFVYDNYLNIGKTIWDPTDRHLSQSLIFFRCRSNGADRVFMYFDAIKNVVNKCRGEVVARFEYTPFGYSKLCKQVFSPWGYSCEHYDRQIESTYYNYRILTHRHGRWGSRDQINDLHTYIFCLNSPEVDFLGLLRYDSSCESAEKECSESVSALSKILGSYIGNDPSSKRKRTDLYRRIKEMVKEKGYDLKQWSNSEDMGRAIKNIKDDLDGNKQDVYCCPPERLNLCDSKTVAAYVVDSPIDPSWEKRIVLCPLGLTNMDKYGGCGCIMLHELLHKHGFSISPGDTEDAKAKNTSMENMMIYIAREMTGWSCNGNDIWN